MPDRDPNRRESRHNCRPRHRKRGSRHHSIRLHLAGKLSLRHHEWRGRLLRQPLHRSDRESRRSYCFGRSGSEREWQLLPEPVRIQSGADFFVQELRQFAKSPSHPRHDVAGIRTQVSTNLSRPACYYVCINRNTYNSQYRGE